MPNVKEGSIVEYRYKIRSEFIFQFRDWEFQWKIPVIYSQYVVKQIPFYQYTWLLQGRGKFDDYKSYIDQGLDHQFGSVTYKNMVYEYTMKDIPAFRDEGFISSINDYKIKLDFQLSKVIRMDGTVQNVMTTWPELIKDLLSSDEFGVYANRSKSATDKLPIIKEISGKSPAQKFDSIMQYVKTNYRWNGETGKYASKTVKNFMKDKSGNDADINLFAVGLLNASGITAFPVIISTRDHGKIKFDYPFSHFFNYVIIKTEIDGKVVLTDATNSLLANNRIPDKCINDKGLIVQKDKIEWVSLQSVIPSRKRIIFLQQVNDSLHTAKAEVWATEYIATNMRNKYIGDKSKIQKMITDASYSVVDTSLVIENKSDGSKPFIMKYKLTGSPEIINGKLYVSPFLNEVIDDNPLKQPTRQYPIDMIYPESRTFYTEITKPDNYVVDFLPSNDKISNDLFDLEYTTTVYDNKICVSFIYYFKVPVYQAADYEKVKYYFKEIVKKGAEKIVLKKK